MPLFPLLCFPICLPVSYSENCKVRPGTSLSRALSHFEVEISEAQRREGLPKVSKCVGDRSWHRSRSPDFWPFWCNAPFLPSWSPGDKLLFWTMTVLNSPHRSSEPLSPSSELTDSVGAASFPGTLVMVPAAPQQCRLILWLGCSVFHLEWSVFFQKIALWPTFFWARYLSFRAPSSGDLLGANEVPLLHGLILTLAFSLILQACPSLQSLAVLPPVQPVPEETAQWPGQSPEHNHWCLQNMTLCRN